MKTRTRKSKDVDVSGRLVDELPGVFRQSLSADGRIAAVELGEATHRYAVSISGALRWAGLVRAVWPQICVCGYRGLTDREMAPVISVAVRLGRPNIELWNAGPKRLEDRRLEISPAVLRDATSAEKRKPGAIPMRHVAVYWLARQRQVDVADIDPAIAAEVDVLSARAKAGIGGDAMSSAAPPAALQVRSRPSGRSSLDDPGKASSTTSVSRQADGVLKGIGSVSPEARGGFCAVGDLADDLSGIPAGPCEDDKTAGAGDRVDALLQALAKLPVGDKAPRTQSESDVADWDDVKVD
ncbi:hypothetical protein ACLF3G_27200 [Falsiroseomonas sp. HC035]|uniref:hypothetical protein n=1 Tax=Falsiroseomonas sp. HC035 TaxID=3390999 RepID=UPI003D31E154